MSEKNSRYNYASDDGPLYEDNRSRKIKPGWDRLDYILLAIFIVALLAFSCAAPAVLIW